jgi:hypothetical protein
MWFLETKGFVIDVQCGFGEDGSTLDRFVRLGACIRDAFMRGEHVVSMFFDLGRAYDTVWGYGVLRGLRGIGLEGYLPNFIKKNF